MELFRIYLKQKRRTIVVMAAFCCIFGVTFWLYHLPVEAVVYPALLCACLGGLAVAASFLRARRNYKFLMGYCAESAAVIPEMPPVRGLEDGAYQALIRTLQTQIRTQDEAAETRYRGMLDYYSIWAHQIKTPIASMRLQLQNEDSPLSRSLQSDLRRIEQYVEMVLAYLRLDSTASDYVFRECPVDEMICQTVKKFSQDFIGRKISLLYEPVEKTIVTDEKWFCFVLEQLISNALKYTQKGSVKIGLQGSTLYIEDTGIGIEAEDLPRIFENGYTGFNGRRDKKASGIGLYLCKRVCDNLGIDIRAASQIGVGTRVTLSLDQYAIGRD